MSIACIEPCLHCVSHLIIVVRAVLLETFLRPLDGLEPGLFLGRGKCEALRLCAVEKVSIVCIIVIRLEVRV